MSTDSIQSENKSSELKHLGFLKTAAVKYLAYFSNLYERAKQNSGTLKSGIQTVEGSVTTVIGPVREKFKGVPNDLLVFLDKKVDKASNKFDEHAPPLAKKVVSKSWGMVQKASQITKTLVTEAQTNGPSAAVNQAATLYKQFLLAHATKGLSKLNQVPLFQKALPTVTDWSEKYNKAVTGMVQKGYPIVGNIPLVPIEKIGKVFNQAEAVGKEGSETSSEGGGIVAAAVGTVTAVVDTITD